MALSGHRLFKKFRCKFRGNISNKENKMERAGIAMVSIRPNENEMSGPEREAEFKVSKFPIMKIIMITYLDGPEDPMNHNYRIIKFDDIESTSNTSEVTVYSKLITPNPESAGDEGVPENEQLVKKLFMDITAQSEYVGMNVVQKQKYDNEGKFYAIVEYFLKSCSCIAQDFKLAPKGPRMQPTITEVEMDLYCMKL